MGTHGTDTRRKLAAPIAGATMALVLLTALNFVNYIDRYILPGVQELVKKEFSVTDSQIGSITFFFFLTYMISAPLTGWLGDHFPRKPLIVICAVVISLVNILTGTVHAFDSLLFRHAILGIGEASLGIYAPALLADFYPEEQRNRILTVFYTAIPVGAAIGYLIGELVGSKYGWRMPFYVSAVPGMTIALLILFLMREPERGATDRSFQKAPERMKPPQRRSWMHFGALAILAGINTWTGVVEWLRGHHGIAIAMAFVLVLLLIAQGLLLKRDGRFANVFDLLTNGRYMFASLGMAMVTFSMGGISAWMPSFLQRSGFSPGSVGITLGAITAGCGLGGTAVGGMIAQRWMKTNPNALFLVSAWSAVLAVPPAVVCFFGPRTTMLPMLAAAMFLIFLGTGPLNAAIINAVPAGVRSTAIAIELLLIHALGDTPSPKLIGIVSDHSTLGKGLGLTLVTLVIASGLLFLGARSGRPIEA